MASEKRPSSEAHDNPDQSIKARKFQIFEQESKGEFKAKPFVEYVKNTPPAPMNPGVKAALWALAVVVALLFIASLFGGRSNGGKGRQARLTGGSMLVVHR